MLFKISSETDLLDCFRPIDRETVVLPKEMQFPLIVKDYYSWVEPSGYRVYLVFRDRTAGGPLGVAFRRDQNPGGITVMCEWCHSVRGGDSVALLSATANSRKTVGIQLCKDLSCRHKLEAAPGVNDIPAIGLTPHEKLQKIVSRMGEFARRELF